MKYKLLLNILLIIVTVFVLFAGYYFLNLAPKIKNARKIDTVINAYSERKVALTQVRLAIVGLANLDTKSKNFGDEQESLLSQLNESQKAENLLPPAQVDIAEFESSDLFDKDTMLETDLKLLNNTLQERYLGLKNIFLYNPEKDFAVVYERGDKDAFIERLGNAREGLKTIKQNVKEPEATNLSGKIDLVITALSQLSSLVLASGDSFNTDQAVQNAVESVNDDFLSLKDEANNYLLAPVRSDKGITTVKDLTNIIYLYDFTILKLDGLKKP